MAITKLQSESLNLADDFAFTGTITGAGESNVPAFYATHTSGTQSISDSTWTTIICNNEVFDTNSGYDTSTGKFTIPSGQAGKYYFNGSACMNLNSTYTSSGNVHVVRVAHFNSSDVLQKSHQVRQNFNYCSLPTQAASGIFDMSVGDYAVVQTYITATTNTVVSSDGDVIYFEGFKIT